MAVVPTGTIEDHHGMDISGDLAADLAEVMGSGTGPVLLYRPLLAANQ